MGPTRFGVPLAIGLHETTTICNQPSNHCCVGYKRACIGRHSTITKRLVPDRKFDPQASWNVNAREAWYAFLQAKTARVGRYDLLLGETEIALAGQNERWPIVSCEHGVGFVVTFYQLQRGVNRQGTSYADGQMLKRDLVFHEMS